MSKKNKPTKTSEPFCFCCWLNKKEAVDKMTVEEAGSIFKAIYEFAKFGTKKEFEDRYIAYVYNDMCADIERMYERHGVSRVDSLEWLTSEEDVKPTVNSKPSDKPEPLQSELVYSTENGYADELTEDESLILCLIDKAKEKFPVRSDGTWRASMKWLKGQLNKGWDDSRITRAKESLSLKGYITYKKDEEARYHLYKILKTPKYKHAG